MIALSLPLSRLRVWSLVHGALDQDDLIRHVREIFPAYECALDNETEFD